MIDTRTRSGREQIRRWGLLGLVLLVAIPLPSTGAWTGAAAASLMGLKVWPAFLAILAGTAVAGAIVLALCLVGLGSVGL